jgi:putative phage-type endonuclease
MHKNLIKISTKDMPHEEWLEHRRKSIGGSEAAAIVGLNPWASPYSVWAEKLGMLPPKEDNEAMRLGRDLEDYVAKRFTEVTGKKVRRENNIIINPKYPFAHANVDRLIIGEDAGLEIKTTTTLNLKRFKNGEYPASYYCQCMHYLAVTGAKRWYLAVLILGKELKVFTIERDDAEICALMRSEEEFWQLVEKKTPPAADGEKSTTEAINTVYTGEDSGADVSLFGYESELSQYVALGDQIKELKKLQDGCANRLKACLGNSSRGEGTGYSVSWAPATRSTFDAQAFARDHSDIDLSGYYKTSNYRTFKVTRNDI